MFHGGSDDVGAMDAILVTKLLGLVEPLSSQVLQLVLVIQRLLEVPVDVTWERHRCDCWRIKKKSWISVKNETTHWTRCSSACFSSASLFSTARMVSCSSSVRKLRSIMVMDLLLIWCCSTALSLCLAAEHGHTFIQFFSKLLKPNPLQISALHKYIYKLIMLSPLFVFSWCQLFLVTMLESERKQHKLRVSTTTVLLLEPLYA